MSELDRRLDDQLRSIGEHWRSTRRLPEERVDPTLFTSASVPASTKRQLLLSFGGVLTLTVVAVLIVVSLPPRDQGVGMASPPPTGVPIGSAKASVTPSQSAPAATPPDVVTPAEAIQAVKVFVGDATLTDDLTVYGPTHGASGPFYEVFGQRVDANVNAANGTIVTLLYTGVAQPGKSTIDRDRATQIAQDFVAQHDISVDGLDREIAFADYGDTSEYVVTWVKHEGVAIAPNSREIDVDAASGRAYRYVSVNRPYEPPPIPQVTKQTAESTAIRAADGSADASIGHSELLITFTTTGVQTLVWRVHVNIGITDHAIVDVDAVTGQASVTYSTASPAPSSPPTAGVSPTSPVPTHSPATVGWVRQIDPGFGYSPSFYSAATNNGVTVVSGETQTDPAAHTGYAATWWTADGANWTESEPWNAVPGNYFSRIQLVAFGDGFAALVDNVRETGDDTYVYLSPDGDQWTLSAKLDGVRILSAASVGGDLVAAGLDDSYAGGIWLSADAMNWRRSADPATSGFTLTSQFAAYGNRLVLMLMPLASPDQVGADIWLSDDKGETWSRAHQPPVANDVGGAYATIGAGPAGWAVAGWFTGDATAGDFTWWSPDGLEWQDAASMAHGVKTIVGYDSGFIAGGYESTGGCCANSGPGHGVTWISADGLNWREVISDGWNNQDLQLLAINGGTLIGFSHDPASEVATPGGLWLGNLETFGQ